MYKQIKADKSQIQATIFTCTEVNHGTLDFSVHSFRPCALYGDAYKLEQSEGIRTEDQKQKHVQLEVALVVQCLVLN